jgi:aspartate-semialdehyde dehydrogenase
MLSSAPDEATMTKKLRVGVVGATGMVGQRFVSLLADHPWFELGAVAASPASAGKPYRDAIAGRWALPVPVPAIAEAMIVADAAHVDALASRVDFVVCAVDMPKADTAKLEEAYARAETPVISNNSAHRWTPDVPMLLPEVNAHHAAIIESQRKRLGTKRGFIAVKPNCSLQSYVPAIHPLMAWGPKSIAVCTYQALSGAGKTHATYPEMADNVIPFIGGEEEKTEQEPLKLWGSIEGGAIVNAAAPIISATCMRVPVSDGHMAAVFVSFERKPSRDQILASWREYAGPPQHKKLPSAPTPFLHYFEQDDRPQTRLDRDAGNGQAITIGRLRGDRQFDWRFVALSHNTVRGAAGGAVLTAELLTSDGYLVAK